VRACLNALGLCTIRHGAVIGSSLHSFCSTHSYLCRSCITEWRHGREGVTLWQKLVRNDSYAMRCCEPAVYAVASPLPWPDLLWRRSRSISSASSFSSLRCSGSSTDNSPHHDSAGPLDYNAQSADKPCTRVCARVCACVRGVRVRICVRGVRVRVF
jgi:hypothetical protein